MKLSVEQYADDAPLRIRPYLTLVIRHRWWVILSAFSFWAIALVGSLLVPAKFRSETVVLIEPQKVLPEVVTPNVTVDLQQQMESLTQQILSRTRLVRIMDAFHLYGKRPNQAADDALVQRMRNDITIDLIKSGGRTDELSAFKVSYSAPTPGLAQAVVGQITALFIQENLHDQQQLSEDTTAFLDHQLDEARQDLEHQEQVLGVFRSKYVGELPEQLSSNVQILTGLQGRLQSETAALHQAEQQKLYLTSLISQSENSQRRDDSREDPDSAGAGTGLDERIRKMKAELAEMSVRYTAQHPDVVRLKEQIANAEAARSQLDAESGKKPEGSDRIRRASGNQQTISPLAQLQSQLKATDLEIANRQQQVKMLERQIEQYQGRLNLTPIREQELADVERNHQQSRTNYDSLLAKKLQSGMATDLAKRQQGQQFSVIDPPSLPQRPYWPNPVQFSLAGLAAGLGLALACIILKEALDPRLRSEEDLRRWFTTKVVAAIPPLVTNRERDNLSRRRVLEFLVGSMVAALIPVMTVIAYWKR